MIAGEEEEETDDGKKKKKEKKEKGKGGKTTGQRPATGREGGIITTEGGEKGEANPDGAVNRTPIAAAIPPERRKRPLFRCDLKGPREGGTEGIRRRKKEETVNKESEFEIPGGVLAPLRRFHHHVIFLGESVSPVSRAEWADFGSGPWQ